MTLRDDEHLISVVNGAPIGLCILDSATLVVEICNDKFIEIAGQPETSLFGRGYWDAFPEAKPFYEPVLQEVIESGKPYYANEQKLMLVRQGKDECIYVTFVYAAITNGDGRITKVAIWVLENTAQVLEREKMITARDEAEGARDRLNAFFQTAPAGICVLSGPDLIFELVNPEYQKLLPGRSLLNRPIFEALPELTGTPIEAILSNVYQTGKTYEINELLVPIATVEGGATVDRYFSFTYQCRRNGKDEIDGVFVFAIEVTGQVMARHKIEESEKHFRYLADIVPAKISNALPSGEVTFFNQKWLDYSQLSFEDLRDFGYHRMMHPDEIPEFQVRLGHAAANGVPLEMEMRFKDLNGNYRWHLNIASPVLDTNGKITMWVGSTTDIQRIKDEEQRKSDFIGMVSHELKTPLSTLNLYLQVLESQFSASDDASTKRSLVQSLKQVKKMTTMINGFLNVTRLESGQLSLNRSVFNVEDLLTELEAELTATNSGHLLVDISKGGALIFADREKIGQVVNNLVSNAIKYSKPGSQVKIDCRVQGNDAVVSVTDQGMGISSTDLSHVFERYFRADTHELISGFGIGLYLCAEIIRLHNGKIWAESELRKGSIFYFSLPLYNERDWARS